MLLATIYDRAVKEDPSSPAAGDGPTGGSTGGTDAGTVTTTGGSFTDGGGTGNVAAATSDSASASTSAAEASALPDTGGPLLLLPILALVCLVGSGISVLVGLRLHRR